MHFINDVDFKASLIGRKIDLIAQISHIIHAGVGGRIDFNQIQVAPLIDCHTMLANIAWPLPRIGGNTIDRFGQQARRTCLPSAPGAGEKVCMPNALASDCVAQGLDHMLLPNNFIPIPWPP